MNADERRFKHKDVTRRIIGVFRADLVVNGSILVVLKALKSLAPVHEA